MAGAAATLLYASANDSWNFNKLLTASSLQNTPIGTTTRAAGNFTTLDANSTVGLSPANANVTISPTGTGTVTISPAGGLTVNPTTLGSIDNTKIGDTTRSSGKFTTLDANGNVIIGSDSSDTVTVNATITSNIIFTDNTYDIGASGATRPRSLFLSQNATLGGNLQVDGNTTIGNADTDTITVGGSFVTGTVLRTTKSITDSLSLAAYDIDGGTYTNLITLSSSNNPTLTIASTDVGSISNMTIGMPFAAAGVFTTITATGLTSLAEITEVLNTKTAATGVVTHDFSTGAIWYHSSISANFTVNLTNVPTTNDRIITVSLILNQGATGRLPSAFQIDGVAQTIRWQNNVTPTPNINIIEVATFSLIRTGSTWFVLGQLAPFA